MSSCGGNDFTRGGALLETTISSSLILGSTVSASTLDSSKITNLTDIDEASAKILLSKLAELSPEYLAVLAKAVSEAMPNTPAGAPPVENAGDALPTTLIGRRTVVLGEPAGWLAMNGLVIPAYESKPQCPETNNG